MDADFGEDFVKSGCFRDSVILSRRSDVFHDAFSESGMLFGRILIITDGIDGIVEVFENTGTMVDPVCKLQ